jgi:isocitrate dehydrogenase
MSKLMKNTNYVDNVGICDSIANNFIMGILKTHNDFDININEDSISDFIPVKKDERNMLDGISFECTFTMHQNDI